MSASGQKNQVIVASIVSLIVGALATFAILKVSPSNETNPVVAKLNGNAIRADKAFGQVKTRVFELEDELYRIKQRAIMDYVEQQLLETEAKKQDKTVDELIQANAGAPSEEVSDEQVSEFLRSKGLKEDDPRIRKSDVKEYIKFTARFEQRQKYVDELKKAASIDIKLVEPASPKLKVTTEGYPSWGKESAKVTIVEFSDFQCPYCSRALPTIQKIKEVYGEDKVRIVFKDMPLRNHPRARPAAMAALCANDQDKFWGYHDTLFENQQKLEDADLKKYAKDMGLDMAKWEKCVKENQFAAKIDASMAEAQMNSIQATPSFVVNGKLVQGAQPFERFQEIIDAELKK